MGRLHFRRIMIVHVANLGYGNGHFVVHFDHLVRLIGAPDALIRSAHTKGGERAQLLTEALIRSCGEPFFFESLRMTSDACKRGPNKSERAGNSTCSGLLVQTCFPELSARDRFVV